MQDDLERQLTGAQAADDRLLAMFREICTACPGIVHLLADPATRDTVFELVRRNCKYSSTRTCMLQISAAGCGVVGVGVFHCLPMFHGGMVIDATTAVLRLAAPAANVVVDFPIPTDQGAAVLMPIDMLSMCTVLPAAMLPPILVVAVMSETLRSDVMLIVLMLCNVCPQRRANPCMFVACAWPHTLRELYRFFSQEVGNVETVLVDNGLQLRVYNPASTVTVTTETIDAFVQRASQTPTLVVLTDAVLGDAALGQVRTSADQIVCTCQRKAIPLAVVRRTHDPDVVTALAALLQIPHASVMDEAGLVAMLDGARRRDPALRDTVAIFRWDAEPDIHTGPCDHPGLSVLHVRLDPSAASDPDVQVNDFFVSFTRPLELQAGRLP